MDKTVVSSIFVTLLFILRCLVPLIIMLGISYLLRRFGLIAEPPQPPEEKTENENDHHVNGEGGLAHGKA
jgi:hypothetical protein